MKIYVFNDLILSVKYFNQGKEEGIKKIFLDGSSFVEAPMDGKYLVNKLLVCGKTNNFHASFANP